MLLLFTWHNHVGQYELVTYGGAMVLPRNFIDHLEEKHAGYLASLSAVGSREGRRGCKRTVSERDFVSDRDCDE